MKKIMKITSTIILIIFGVFLFIYGEYDDSPGGQLIGLVLFLAPPLLMLKKYLKMK